MRSLRTPNVRHPGLGYPVVPICGLLAALAGCRPADQSVAPDVLSSAGADQIMSGVTINLAVDGRSKNYVTADSAFTYPEAQRLEFVRMKAAIFDADGQQIAALTAKRGVYTIGDRRLDARGDVVVVTPRGDSLRSARVTYDNTLRQFQTDSAFVLKAKTGLVNGKGFTADGDLRNLVPGRKR